MRRAPAVAAWVVLALVAGSMALAAPGTALAAGTTWGTPEAKSTYGQLIEFQQPATLPAGTSRVEILLDFPGADGPFVADVGVGATGTPTTLAFNYDTTTSHLYPNTHVGARWRVTLADGTTEVGPQVSTTYADTGFPWKTKTGKTVRIHWYQGDEAFADRALAIGEAGIEKASKLLGVTETEPVDFFVYASQAAFYAAAGPGTRENVGGFALPEIRTLFALILPDEIDASWVGTVIPHELTHLVFDTAVQNPYHYPPRWLNEGVAVYLSEGYASSYRKDLKSGVADGRILPLAALSGEFPTAADQFFLAYAESVSAVSYIIDTYGQDALVRLIRAYAAGVSDDDAFRTGLGLPLADVEAGWLASIGARTPTVAGPVPAPAGPVPSDWSGPGGAIAPTPVTGSAEPTASGATAAPATAATSPTGEGGATDRGGTSPGVLLLAVGAFLVAVALGAVLAVRSRRPRPPAAPMWPPPAGPDPAAPPDSPAYPAPEATPGPAEPGTDTASPPPDPGADEEPQG